MSYLPVCTSSAGSPSPYSAFLLPPEFPEHGNHSVYHLVQYYEHQHQHYWQHYPKGMFNHSFFTSNRDAIEFAGCDSNITQLAWCLFNRPGLFIYAVAFYGTWRRGLDHTRLITSLLLSPASTPRIPAKLQ